MRFKCQKVILEICINWHTKSQGLKKKNYPFFQEGGSTPAPPTPPVIRVIFDSYRAEAVDVDLVQVLYANDVFAIRSIPDVHLDLQHGSLGPYSYP